jgi:hypothetical protein
MPACAVLASCRLSLHSGWFGALFSCLGLDQARNHGGLHTRCVRGGCAGEVVYKGLRDAQVAKICGRGRGCQIGALFTLAAVCCSALLRQVASVAGHSRQLHSTMGDGFVRCLAQQAQTSPTAGSKLGHSMRGAAFSDAQCQQLCLPVCNNACIVLCPRPEAGHCGTCCMQPCHIGRLVTLHRAGCTHRPPAGARLNGAGL